MRSLQDVTIGIKTFLREPQLFAALRDIRDTMPEVCIIVADDGDPGKKLDIYFHLLKSSDELIVVGFDAGFGKKSNLIADALKTKYLLIASDDFDFSRPSVRDGIEQLAEVLDYTDVDIASGRVDNRPYEFRLVDEGNIITEVPVDVSGSEWFVECDLTVNYSLIKKHVFEKARWDDDVKIGGGEHGAFFLDCKRAGFKTAYVPGVNINSQKVRDSNRYRQFRARANSSERPCFVKRNVVRYVLGNGTVDWDVSKAKI